MVAPTPTQLLFHSTWQICAPALRQHTNKSEQQCQRNLNARRSFMTARRTDNRFNWAIWCGYTALQHQGDSQGSYTALGQVHISRLSDAVYHIQHLKTRRKRLVVHFDRLKRGPPDTRLPPTVSNQQQPSRGSPRRNRTQPGPGISH